MGTFTISKGRDGQFYWSLKAVNGQILCHSEGYVSKQGAENGIAACKQLAAFARIVDETASSALGLALTYGRRGSGFASFIKPYKEKMMNPNDYLTNILARERVDNSSYSPVLQVQQTISPILHQAFGNMLVGFEPSGSYAKGTANKSSTDIDIFISISSATGLTLQELQQTLCNQLLRHGYNPTLQNVSLGLRIGGYDVDLVPGKRQDQYGGDHSLYMRKKDTWIKTNVKKHISHVQNHGRQNETRIIKLWRNQKGLDFPSFYLELSVIAALSSNHGGSISANVVKVLEYLGNNFSDNQITDPANTNNVISDTLTRAEKLMIAAAANDSLRSNWEALVK